MSQATDRLAAIAKRRTAGERAGIASICSAHPLVIEAALRHGKARGADVLIEATCNQVNHEGGYTGMTPGDFRRFVETIAGKAGFPLDRLVLGGDHLGPNPWKHLPAPEAMEKAARMVDAYAEAGFTKIHLDASMGCAGEGAAPPDATIAARAAELAEVAEAAVERTAGAKPVYVIGTEVPVPGGALEAMDHLAVTTPEAAGETVRIHQQAFHQRGLDHAFSRAIGVVVQPGVEFGNAEVITYRPERARALAGTLRDLPQFVFEAHSTDYQPVAALTALVDDGFAILKVGPWLTFALREALYGLSHIADILAPDPARESLPAAMERVMLEAPGNWKNYYHGSEAEQRSERHFSYSDRIRYYWPAQAARQAVDALMQALGERDIPSPLISQYLGRLDGAVASGSVAPKARELLIAAVTDVLDIYASATG
ncbi:MULTISPECIES: D-tagatose-bisphosphate aldolase, class II, non-catalytic subunit [unclassified Mesorhizobium]|uniref:D-tagatose-bisphosphate aldolase, class II, non-catalytic subunit n=1 Tax=unclassified Mesorhizobium TaxID=325217 RepID=UPI000FD44D3F|nr:MULTISPECIES: D-tagatose-bisphosphate aldolase, class II, non-catalytic subunit [unclassified Mesorhizobium]RUX02813.1 D-tagatose-bisphosphate aldolase, class II, non-catalytic subunit [Mesorhizobium sp. M8A.F.Ca.ET.059.01.1.1]TGR44202.1 D-tagatose-bisphosphate aldolase, class II, non-catalytic subunit [bacterium M00.F.Ca.ET.199.01.1.1]TGU33067.1 D-tagatose-bisphosphate aldolase, class II, non-catalytic subunit [bacterium M00.F.Ca.ET.156.01.1.1]TGV87272.1 D-tagatose-bisphosphate aldolase, cl